MRPLLLLVCFLASAAAHAASSSADETWMRVMLDGRKIGSMHTTRSVRGEHVITAQTMDVQLDRAGVKVRLSSSETDTETRDGKPLAFETRTAISGVANVVRGTLREDGRFDVVSDIGGARQRRVIDWPKGALLAEGQRLATRDQALTPGTRFEELAFQAESLDAVKVESTVAARERVELPEGDRLLTRIDQQIQLPGAPSASTTWVDADQNVFKMTMGLMGYDLAMIACSRNCAQGPNQATDILTHAMVQVPAPIDADALAHGVTLHLRSTRDGPALQFANTDEQRVRSEDGGVELVIAPLDDGAAPNREDKPVPADTAANDWLQSDAPEIRKLAHDGAGNAREPREQMQRLEDFVRSYIRTKDLTVGYASALEVARKPEGDCTEHAVLLAALGRALGIPTRVVDGLAYTDRYAGLNHVFVPHAWTQAWVDGHWKSFDAALHGFDAGHVALAVGDGDPWRFFAGFDTLGRMRVEAISPAITPAAATP
jgi:hypothetical protein